MGFLQSGQTGGGVSFGMRLTLDQARVSVLTVTDCCRGRSGDAFSLAGARTVCLSGTGRKSSLLTVFVTSELLRPILRRVRPAAVHDPQSMKGREYRHSRRRSGSA